MKKTLMKTLAITALAAATSMGLAASTAQASVIWYEATLSGPAEAPPNASPGTGYARVIVDDVLHTMQVTTSFSGLLGTTTASHIHCCIAAPGAAGVATQTPSFVGFPLGVTAGSYDHLFDLTLASSYRAAFITANGGVAGAEAALLAGLASNQAYLNIHSTAFPGGEIRGFLGVPEPTTLALITMSLLSLLVFGRKRRRAGA
jgi:hypothetical protein